VYLSNMAVHYQGMQEKLNTNSVFRTHETCAECTETYRNIQYCTVSHRLRIYTFYSTHLLYQSQQGARGPLEEHSGQQTAFWLPDFRKFWGCPVGDFIRRSHIYKWGRSGGF